MIAEDGANSISRSTPIAFRASGTFWVNNHAHLVQSLGGLPLGYIEWYLNGTNLQFFVTGTAQLKLNQVNLSRIPFPVAPLNEQRRIVAKIEELFSDLDAGVAALRRAKANLRRYRASVLKAAVEGRLTADWRAQHPNVETASQLLERILKERRQKWEADQLAKFADAGKPPPKNWRDKYVEPASPDTSGLPELPEGWCWATVDQLLNAGTCNGISVKGRSDPPGTPALRLNSMTDKGFDYSQRRYIDIPEIMVKDLALRDFDFFVSRGNGSLHLVGRGTLASLVTETIVFPDTMIRVRLAQQPVIPTFLSTIWPSRPIRAQIESKARATAGIYKISQRDVEGFVVPLPPLDEQGVVVAEVAEKLSQIDSAEQAIEHGLQRAARLRQSILKDAFAGKLVPQDPADEPASALLERLKASQPAASSNGASPRRRSPRRATKKGDS